MFVWYTCKERGLGAKLTRTPLANASEDDVTPSNFLLSHNSKLTVYSWTPFIMDGDRFHAAVC